MEDLAGSFFGYVLVCLFGLAFGSFLNVVIYRLPIIEERQWRRAAREILEEAEAEAEVEAEVSMATSSSAAASSGSDAATGGSAVARADEPAEKSSDASTARAAGKRSPGEEEDRFTLLYPPSHCPKCRTRIGPFSNVPILSWILQKGKCKHCGRPISIQYPLVEFFTMVMVAMVFHGLGFTVQAVWGTLFTLTMICLMAIDARKMLLLDVLTLPLMWIGLMLNAYDMFGVPLKDAVLGAFWGYMSLWIVTWLFKLLTGKVGMGNGDFKLLAAMGAWMGWRVLPLIVIMSCVVGLIGSLVMRIGKNREMPFGPYLGMAGWLVFVFRDEFERLVNWWMGLSGF